jgi:hypothetical protein
MIGFIDTFLQLQSIITAHNESSAELFYLDRRALPSFRFSFYDCLQTTFIVSYKHSARTTRGKHIENLVS